MFDERARGTYIQNFRKEVDCVEFTKKESTMINDKNEVVNFVREYSPAMKFSLDMDNGWEEVLEQDNSIDFDR